MILAKGVDHDKNEISMTGAFPITGVENEEADQRYSEPIPPSALDRAPISHEGWSSEIRATIFCALCAQVHFPAISAAAASPLERASA